MFTRIFLLCCAIISLSHGWPCEDISGTLHRLSEYASNEQVKETKPYKDLMHMSEREGYYRTSIFFNTHGSMIDHLARTKLIGRDDNIFAAGFVGPKLIDAYRFGNAPKPPEDDILRLTKLFVGSLDPNVDYNTSMMGFYYPIYNPDTGTYLYTGVNLQKTMEAIAEVPGSDELFLRVIAGKDWENTPPGFTDFVTPSATGIKYALSGDFDSTGLNLIMGSMLSNLQDAFPDAWALWSSANTNVTSVMDRLKTRVYRPFSDDRNVNTIDTRIYYVAREFLERRKNEGKDVALIPLWDLDINTLKTYGRDYGFMPGGVNSIEIGIAVNFLTDSFAALDAGLIPYETVNEDPDLNLIIESTSDYIAYTLETNYIYGRSDITIMYYGSEYEGFWLASRGLLYMENAKLRGTLQNVPVYEGHYNKLSKVLRTTTTTRLLGDRKFDNDFSIYYDEFLGNGDKTFDGKGTITRGEDRYFITATVANTLIYTWAVYDEELGSMRWLESAPYQVKATVYGIFRWLVKNPFGGVYGVTNAVYLNGVASIESYPFWYPANRFEYMNGTKIENFDRIPLEDVIIGMEGHVSAEEYQKLLDVDQFGFKTPQQFLGRNAGQGTGIYWSSDAISYASAMIALSLTDALQKSDNYVCDYK